jgi:phosphoribosylamine--glycine ligase
MATIVEPTIHGLATEGMPYTGILYAGLMLTTEGPRVLEFNARFGDPETQVILPRWNDDLCKVLATVAAGRLADLPLFSWSESTFCGVVLASSGYPGLLSTGGPIQGLAAAETRSQIFQSGTRYDAGTRQVHAAGGRVLTIVGRGTTLEEARTTAYHRARQISFEGCWCRDDIGAGSADASMPPWHSASATPLSVNL